VGDGSPHRRVAHRSNGPVPEVPPEPRIHCLYDAAGGLTYVGKPHNLRGRLAQYRMPLRTKEDRTEAWELEASLTEGRTHPDAGPGAQYRRGLLSFLVSVLLSALSRGEQIELRRIDGWRKIAAVRSQHTIAG
jgi:hypothetical protein